MNSLMKTFYFLVVAFLLSCGQQSASADTTTAANSTATASTASTQETPNLKPTNTTLKTPERGGPADIKLNVNGLPDGQSFLIGFSGESHYRADSSAIVNTVGLDGFLIIGYDDKTKSFFDAKFSNSNLKDSSKKLFSQGLTEEQVEELRKVLIEFRFKLLNEHVQKVAESKELSAESIDDASQEHRRIL